MNQLISSTEVVDMRRYIRNLNDAVQFYRMMYDHFRGSPQQEIIDDIIVIRNKMLVALQSIVIKRDGVIEDRISFFGTTFRIRTKILAAFKSDRHEYLLENLHTLEESLSRCLKDLINHTMTQEWTEVIDELTVWEQAIHDALKKLAHQSFNSRIKRQ